MKTPRGFTLLEVLIALAILAIAMLAATRAVGLMTDSAAGLKQRMVASWIAQDQLAQHMARGDWPETGSKTGQSQQAGFAMEWEERVTQTPNAAFRRIEIRVYATGHLDYALAQLVGYLVRQKVPA